MTATVRVAPALRTRSPRTAFVLSGGASLGAMQVGMLGALYERGIVPDLLVGTSAGALNAAFVASRPQTPATAHELAGVWRGLEREDVFPVSLPTLFAGVTSRTDHLVPDRGLRRLARRHLQLDALENARIAVHVVALDLITGGEVRLSTGPAVEAVMAAAAIPGVLPPVRVGDRLLVDGGVANNTPISHAVELGAQRVYVLPTTGTRRGRPRAPAGAVDAAVHAVTLLVGHRLRADLERYAAEVELIVLPTPDLPPVQPTDFSQAGRLILEARAAARAALAGPVPSVVAA